MSPTSFSVQPYNLAFPSMNWSHTPVSSESAVSHRVARKLRVWPAPNNTQARKVPFSALQLLDRVAEIRIGEQRVEGEEGGVQRAYHGCEHRRTAVRATVQLRPETPGKHSRGISGTTECFILIHMLLWSSGQLWITNMFHVIDMFWFYSIL